MFKRLALEDWHTTLAILAFFITFGTFIFLVIRAILMKKEDRDHMANLPLENHTPPAEPENDTDHESRN
jgi:hypothetical protein